MSSAVMSVALPAFDSAWPKQLEQFLARGGLGHESRADSGAQRHELFLPQQLQEPPVSREDHRQQRRGIEVGTGEDPQLAEDLGAHLLGFVDQAAPA